MTTALTIWLFSTAILTALCTVGAVLSTRHCVELARSLRKRIGLIDEAVLEVEAQRSRINKLAGRVYWDERHPRVREVERDEQRRAMRGETDGDGGRPDDGPPQWYAPIPTGAPQP